MAGTMDMDEYTTFPSIIHSYPVASIHYYTIKFVQHIFCLTSHSLVALILNEGLICLFNAAANADKLANTLNVAKTQVIYQ